MTIGRVVTIGLLLSVTTTLDAQSPLPERITSTINSYPDASVDGRRIVFQSNRTGIPQIYVIDRDRGRTEQLTDEPGGAETPVWSPDGAMIAYAVYVAEGDNDVFLMNADGSGRRRLTDGPGYDGHPHWSHDGTRIVFNSDRTSEDLSVAWADRWHEIFSVRIDGTDLRQHTRCRSVCTYGSLSPDGTKILYRKILREPSFAWDLTMGLRNSEIFIADLDGSNEVNLSRSAAFDGWPAWSPSGTRIIFSSNRAGPANVGQLYVIDANGSGLRQLTTGPWSYAQPSWSRDGTRIYAYQHQENPLFEFGDLVAIAVPD